MQYSSFIKNKLDITNVVKKFLSLLKYFMEIEIVLNPTAVALKPIL